MSFKDKMTSLANQVRRLSNTPPTELLSVDDMVAKMSSITATSEIDRNSIFKKIIERTVTEITADDLAAAGITKIGNRAFMNCDYLTKVTLPDTITSLGGSAFNSCDSLVEVNLPASVDTIDADAFYECVALEELAMPDNVGWVGAYALGACRNLKRVTWTARACGLVNGCFSGCTSLEYIDFSKCIKVAELDALSVLNGVPSTCKFYVPVGLLDKWKKAANWCDSSLVDRIMVKPETAYFVNSNGDSWEFQFEEGMTWADAFANPTYRASIDAVGHSVYIESGSVYIGWSGDSRLCSANDKIISGHQYYLGY